MSRFAALPNQQTTPGAASAASGVSAPTSANTPTRTRRKNALLLTIALVGLTGALARLAWLSEPVQEWRLRRASLPALVRERGTKTTNPRLLYYIGLRLNQQGRFAEAESNLRAAVGMEMESARLRDEWARALLGTGRITEAFGQLREFAGTHPNSAPAHTILGKFYFTQRAMQRADDEFERAVTLDPSQAEAWAYLSQAASQLNLGDRPLEAARHAVGLQPENAGYRLLLAPLLERANQQDAAGQEYARAVELAPKNAVAHQLYALWLSTHAAKPETLAQAEAEARKALALDANNPVAQLVLGRTLRAAGRATEAIPPLTKAAELTPDDPAPAQTLAQVYTTLGQANEAATWRKTYLARQDYLTQRNALYQQLRVQPDDRDLHLRMAKLLGAHGDVDGCVRNFAMALHTPTDSARPLAAAAKELTQAGFVSQSLPLAQRAVALGPHSPDTREALGDALLLSGHVDEAIANYNFTTAYAPHRARALQARVNQYVAAHPQPVSPAEAAYREASSLMNGQIGLQRTPLRAEELAQKAVTLDPGNPTYLRLLLRIQFGQRKTTEAIATARQLLQSAPQDAPTHALLAAMLVEQAKTPADYDEVEFHLNAGKAPETEPQTHYTRGLLALKRQNGALAAQELRKAAELDPSADVTFYKIAQAERMAGHSDAAAQAMAEYQKRQNAKREEFGLQGDISQHPDQPERYLKLARYYEQHGRTAEAKAMREVVRQRFSPDGLKEAKRPSGADVSSASSGRNAERQ